MTQTAQTLAEIDQIRSVHPYTNLSAHKDDGPFVITRGDGIYVWDDQGNEYLDLFPG